MKLHVLRHRDRHRKSGIMTDRGRVTTIYLREISEQSGPFSPEEGMDSLPYILIQEVFFSY